MTASNKALRIYKQTAIMVLNTILLLVAVNLALWVVFEVRDQKPAVKPASYDRSPQGYFYEKGGAVDNGKRTPSNLTIFDYKAYEGVLSESEIARLLDEFYDHAQQGYDYQAYSQYAHRPVVGSNLNVELEPNGLTVRRTVNSPENSEQSQTIRIFAFGGSTTFGAGLPDEHTWPSHLSQILNAKADEAGLDIQIEVTNYGRVGFYPTQELHLLMEVLRSGERPDLAIFLDGLNFGRDDDTPSLTTDYIRTINAAQGGQDASRWRWLPIVRAASALRDRSVGSSDAVEPTPAETQKPRQVVERFLQLRSNTLALAKIYNFEAVFFLQPDAHYNYPAHLFGVGELPINPAIRAFKGRVYRSFPDNSGWVDLTGLFEEWGNRKAIIDSGHYSPNFSRFVAQKIADQIDIARLKAMPREDAVPTGIPRQR